MKTHIVMGGTGVIGAAIVRALSGVTEDTVHLLGSGTHVSKVLPQTVNPVVWYAAGHTNLTGKERMIRDNLLFTETMDWVQRYDVNSFYLVSSSSIYDEPKDDKLSNETEWDRRVMKWSNRDYTFACRYAADVTMHMRIERQYGAPTIHRDFRVFPVCNVYGEADFGRKNLPFIAGMVKRLVDAKRTGVKASLKGNENVIRDVMHADDVGRAIVHAATYVPFDVVNIGPGRMMNMREYASLIADALEIPEARNSWGQDIRFSFENAYDDKSELKKSLESSRLHSRGWGARVPLIDGIKKMVKAYEDRT